MQIVGDEEWIAARRELLVEEKAFQAQSDELARKRQALPWRCVEAQYVFEGAGGQCTFSELFDGSSQLIVYHFMFHPEWEDGCKSCSFWADSFDRSIEHLRARDAAMVAVSRAPFAKLMAYQRRMGWTFPWLSSFGSQFNTDFNVSFTPDMLRAGSASYNYVDGASVGEEMPGISVFVKVDETIYHSYSTFSRGIDPFNATYQFLDIVPMGRDEAGLNYPMEWLRRRGEYSG
ncbi:hypothetical protein BMS3Bbin02_02017 [bacterium BMS3Bbin02]|nr:hypothetical protein BMS3Bbin02_02017 [bacterium BMS3Bbin02]